MKWEMEKHNDFYWYVMHVVACIAYAQDWIHSALHRNK